MIPQDLKYSDDHEWVRAENGVATIGITHFAQDQLGDIVYVELPAVGDSVKAGENFGVVESVKTVSQMVSPLSGEVIEVNSELEESPEKVNEEPYEGGWMLKVKMSDEAELASLLDAAAYAAITE